MMTRKRPDFPAGPAAQRATTWLCLAAAGACVGKALVLPPPAPVSASPSAAHAERGGGASATACGLTFALAATNRVYGDDGSPNRTAILGAGFAHSTSNKACATEASDGNVAPLAAGVWKCAANAWEGYSATTLPVFQHGTDALGAADAILRAKTRHSRSESAGSQTIKQRCYSTIDQAFRVLGVAKDLKRRARLPSSVVFWPSQQARAFMDHRVVVGAALVGAAAVGAAVGAAIVASRGSAPKSDSIVLSARDAKSLTERSDAFERVRTLGHSLHGCGG